MAGERGAGAPALDQRVITDVDYPAMYRLWVRGASAMQIAERLGFKCSRQNVLHHLSRIRSQMRVNMLRDRNEVLTELAAIRFAAWESFEKSQTPVKMDEVRRELAKAVEASKDSPDPTAQVTKQLTRLVSKHGGDATWLHVVIAAIEQECKLTGVYEASKIEATLRRPQIDELRVAGSSPEQVQEMVAKRLAEVLTKMRASVHGEN